MATPTPPARPRPDDDELHPQSLHPQARDHDRRHVKLLSADDTLVPLTRKEQQGPLAAK